MSSPVWPRKLPGGGTCVPTVALLCLAAGCATQTKQARGPVAPPVAGGPARLAWLPLEPLVSPEIAAAGNASLANVRLAGTSRSFKAPVSMEVAQLAIECIQPTAACYGAVGRSLGAERLVWAELHAKGADDRVEVVVQLFDVAGSPPVQRAERKFQNMGQARVGIAPFIEEALGGGPAPAPAQPAVAGKPPSP
jgi:hypothetical protein